MAITAATMPWLIDVNVFMTAIAHTNWSGIAANATAIRNGYSTVATTAQNNEINFDVIMAAGTWTFELLHWEFTDRGIYSVQLDGVEVGTIDGYNGVSTVNSRDSVTGVTVATSGKKRLKLIMATKNASSSGYAGRIQHIQLRRTA